MKQVDNKLLFQEALLTVRLRLLSRRQGIGMRGWKLANAISTGVLLRIVVQ